MQIYKYPSCKSTGVAIPECALALGLFDGVHIAHRDLILRAKENAARLGLPFGIFTFASDTGIKGGSPRLYSDDDKLDLFERIGADLVIVSDFKSIRDMSAECFVKDVLIRDCGCRFAVAGFNFRFGKFAAAGAEELCELMSGHGYGTQIVDELKYGDDAVSTTLIRAHIADGRIEKANVLLGSPYFIKGKVEHGNRVGRSLGFPTVNLPLDDERAALRRGVYRSAVVINGKIYSSVTNIGICPTFDERRAHAETYILDFTGEIYGDEITVYLLGYLRDEVRFSTPEALIEQINKDKEKAKKENGDLTWQELGLNLQ